MSTGNGKGIVGANGKPIEAEEDASQGEDISGKKLSTDPRRMDTGLLLYNLMVMVEAERSLGRQLEGAQMIKKTKQHVGDLPGEAEMREYMNDAMVRRSILVHTVRDRFADFDKAYWAKNQLEPLHLEVELDPDTEVEGSA